jgi:O-antigen/teichoic acid export membrane protein
MTAAEENILTSPEAGGRVIRGSALRVIGYGAGMVLMAAASVLLLRYLGVVKAGRYFTVMALVSIAGTIADAGLSVIGSRELALRETEHGRRRLLGNLLGLRLVITPAGILGAVGFAIAAGYPREMVAGTALAGAGVLLLTLQATLTIRLTVDLRQGRIAVFEIVKQLVTVAAIAALVVATATLTPFFAVQIAVGVVVIVLTPILAGRSVLVAPRFDRAEWRWLFREALPVAAAFVVGTLYFRAVILLMSVISSEREVGLFGTSLRIMETLAGVPVLVAGIALPLLTAAARDDAQRFTYALQRLTDVAVLAGVLAVVVTAIAADEVVTIIGGEEYVEAGDVLRVQVGALLGIFLSQLWSGGLIALHRQRELIAINAIALVALGAIGAAFVARWGALGGAAATVVGDALLAGLLLVRLRRGAAPVKLTMRHPFRLVLCTGISLLPALVPGLPALVAAALAAIVFAGAARVTGVLPPELLPAFSPAARRGGAR